MNKNHLYFIATLKQTYNTVVSIKFDHEEIINGLYTYIYIYTYLQIGLKFKNVYIVIYLNILNSVINSFHLFAFSLSIIDNPPSCILPYESSFVPSVYFISLSLFLCILYLFPRHWTLYASKPKPQSRKHRITRRITMWA